MNKLQMVQNMILTEIRRVGICSIDDEKLQEAWSIADKMQAEADKREKEESNKQKIKCDEKIEINMYPEYDATINYPPDAWVMYLGEKRLAVSIKEEWQPDWSQAPDGYDWFAVDKKGTAYFYTYKPETIESEEYWADFTGISSNGMALESDSSFNYTGDWRNSLRKRPE